MRASFRPVHRPATALARTSALAFSALAALGACGKSSFNSSKKGEVEKQTAPVKTPPTKPTVAPSKTPPKTPPQKETRAPIPETGTICVKKRKAARIAFVIDNSGSHGRADGSFAEAHETHFTDPVRQDTTPFSTSGKSTTRQRALYDLVTEAARLDALARSTDANYAGTEVGIVSFPKSYLEQDTFGLHSGRGALPQKMTNLAGSPFDDARKQALWNDLAFTHKPDGVTPYAVGLHGAKDLLDGSGNVSEAAANSDGRERHVIFLTDGLPTDEQPSLVLAARTALKNVKFHLVNVHSSSQAQSVAKDTSYEGLRDWFLNQAIPHAWALRPGHTDGYAQTEAGFSSYWSDLLGLPQKIADSTVDVETQNLQKEMQGILAEIQGCP